MVIEIYGKGVEEKDLTGEESLSELISKFREEGTLIKRGNFPSMIKQFKKDSRNNQRNLQGTISEILIDIPLYYQDSDIKGTLDYLIEEYICSEFGAKYDRISEDLFNLKRTIPYETGKEKIKVRIPLFASVDFFRNEDWVFKDNYIVNKSSYNSYDVNIEIKSKRPPIIREVREKARIARAEFLSIFSNALREQFIGDLLMRENKVNYNLKVYWIPKPSELKINVEVIDKDPILIAHICNRNYLISSWNVEGEEPYEHYIREFSEGKLKISAGKLKI